MLALVESGAGVTLETGVFVVKSLSVFAGDSNLKNRKHKICVILIPAHFRSSTADQSELLLVMF